MTPSLSPTIQNMLYNCELLVLYTQGPFEDETTEDLFADKTSLVDHYFSFFPTYRINDEHYPCPTDLTVLTEI